MAEATVTSTLEITSTMANATHSPGLVANILGAAAYHFDKAEPYLPMYAHMILSALLPIYTGAHASLSRPSSAAKPSKKSTARASDEDEDDEEEEETKMEGLTPSDAILFPVAAGCTLTGLYFLIKWLDDPDLLNKILGWFLTGVGVFGTANFLSDAMHFFHSLVFPSQYVEYGTLWKLDYEKKQAVPPRIDEPTTRKYESNIQALEVSIKESMEALKQEKEHKKRIGLERSIYGMRCQKAEARRKLAASKQEPRASPLPSVFSNLSLLGINNRFNWYVASIPRRRVILRINEKTKTAISVPIDLFKIISIIAAFGATIYFNTVAKPWYLTNLLGFSTSYSALQLMSPTTFGTGALLLSALFFYDIYMVFYTPMMIKVATTLDVPIKLVFPKPGGGARPFSMLGLGDVVLPGIMIGLALRFDLYLHYLRRQKSTKTDSGKTEIKKQIWRPVSGRWAESLWLSGSTQMVSSTSFDKPYFTASLVGYVLGMFATIAAMQVMGRGQPALLYLVPGVLLSQFLTALFRGEVKEMWEFSEAVEEEAETSLKEEGKNVVGKAKEGVKEVVEKSKVAANEVKRTVGSVLIQGAPPVEKLSDADVDAAAVGAEKGEKHKRDRSSEDSPEIVEREDEFSSSWGSAASSSDEGSPEKMSDKRLRTLADKSKKAKTSVHGDENTFFSITLSWPGKKASKKDEKNWKETRHGDEGGAPSGKRMRVA